MNLEILPEKLPGEEYIKPNGNFRVYRKTGGILECLGTLQGCGRCIHPETSKVLCGYTRDKKLKKVLVCSNIDCSQFCQYNQNNEIIVQSMDPLSIVENEGK